MRFGLYLIFLLPLISCSDNNESSNPTIPIAPATTTCVWEAYGNNPIIDSNYDSLGDLIINDPVVIKEGSTYRIWFSKGTGLGINHVRIYQGTSTDGINWNLDNTAILGPNSDATASGSPTPDVTGTYQLIGEDTTNFTNNKPAFKLNGQNWYLWYDTTNSNYRISSDLAADGTSSWIGDGGTIVDGTYIPHSGAATNNITITSNFDSEKTETPMVIKVGSTYHLYYSSFKVGDGAGKYQVGHATSSDGTSWTKDDANNPVIAYHDDPNQWGWYQAAEPGVIYNTNDSKFYLYYTTAIYRGPAYDGTDYALKQGIGVATSSDGSSFTAQGVAIEQSANYSVDDGYVGYSTPFALIDSQGLFHLFYDAASYSTGNWMQISLAHATGSDGLNFTEIESDIFTINSFAWANNEVRAPAVIEEDGEFKMYFAGNNDKIFQPDFIAGIGLATKNTNCQ